MASAPDSQPFFEQHALKIGMEQTLLHKFLAGGIKTVSQAAYAATPPGQVLTDDKVTDLCNKLGAHNVSLNQLTVVKRLLFEAQHTSRQASTSSQRARSASCQERKGPRGWSCRLCVLEVSR